MSRNNNGKNKVVLKIGCDATGIFMKRENRFLASVEIHGKICKAHVHDPGRLRELLYYGNRVLLKRYPLKGRKTEWELIAANKNGKWIFINSKFHRAISESILKNEKISPLGKVENLRAEVKIGNSRIDFIATKERKNIWIEVKGCTLEEGGFALFPDAPTTRGRKHVEELINLRKEGDRAAIIFLIFVNAKCFKPNEKMDAEFSKAFYRAIEQGVEIYPILLSYDSENLKFKKIISLCGKN